MNSLPRKGSIVAVVILTTLLAAIVPGAVWAIFSYFLRSPASNAVRNLDLSFALFFTVSLGSAGILTAPLLVFLARITRLKSAVFVGLAASTATYVLYFTEASHRFLGSWFYQMFGPADGFKMQSPDTSSDTLADTLHRFISAHQETPLVELFGVAIAHILLISACCLVYRFSVGRSAAVHGSLGIKSDLQRSGTPGERNQFGKIAFATVAVLCISGFLYRVNQIASIPGDAWNALQDPREMTVFSLEGEQGTDLGDIPVSKASDRRLVSTSLRKLVAASYSFGVQPMCFNPRHKVRVTDNAHTYDFLICFECIQMIVFKDNQPVGGSLIHGSSDTLDTILGAAGVPIEVPDTPNP